MSKLFSNIWFKCITVLLLIAVIAGGLLAVLNDLLYVSPNERTARAVKKIYGVEKVISDQSIILDVDGEDASKNTKIICTLNQKEIGSINKIFKLDNGDGSYDMLFQSTGYEGYKGGTVTVWVQVTYTEDANPFIAKVLLESYDKQTLMSKFGGEFFGKFALIDVTETYESGLFFSPTDNSAILNPVSGATYSANAGCNAVNCVINYVGGAK